MSVRDPCTQHHLLPRQRQPRPSRGKMIEILRVCRHPISAAAGSRNDLDKSEHEREAEHKRLCRDIGAERGQSVSKDLSHVSSSIAEPSEAEDSAERPHSKDRKTEKGRSRERRRPESPDRPPPPSLLFPPAAPSHPI